MEKWKILLVDKNIDDVELTRRALSKETHWEVITAYNSEMVLDQLDAMEKEQRPDVMLVDIKPLRMDIDELVWALRTRTNEQIPVWIMTSSRFHVDLKKCYDAGAQGCIEKPVTPGKLREIRDD